MATTMSMRAIQDARSGILRFGNSTHVPRHLTLCGETISRVAAGRYHSAMVCRSGRVYTVDDGNGGHTPKMAAGLESVHVLRAACGDRFTCVVTSEGELYTITGTGVAVLVVGVPKMRTVSAGAGHFIAVSQDGGAWASGLNAHGQLGVGDHAHRASPVMVPGVGNNVMEASCAGHRTALVTRDGFLYVAGSNAYNALGLGSVSDVNTFQRLELVSPVAAIACGDNHMVALTVEGTVWAWGQNYYGQLGVGANIEVTCKPAPVDGLCGLFVTEISAGGEHTALVTDEGVIFACGSGGEGELGGGEDVYMPVRFPLSLPPDLRLQQVVCVCNATLVLLEGIEEFPAEAPIPIPTPTPTPEPPTPPPEDVTDWERSIMATLECPICFRIMCAPIHQCAKGHNFCDACRSRSETQRCCLCREPFVGTRNMALETLGETLRLPCPDCLLRMPVHSLESHAAVCPQRTFCCPLLNSCGWTGMPGDVLPHAMNRHGPCVWEKFPRQFSHRYEDAPPPVLLFSHGQTFVLHRRFDRSSDGFRVVAGLLGSPGDKPGTYELRVEFIADEGGRHGRLVYSREVCANAGDVEQMLFSNSTIVLRRQRYGGFFRRNQVTCSVQILAMRK